jgi:polysaccharide biosynthesis/export protein
MPEVIMKNIIVIILFFFVAMFAGCGGGKAVNSSQSYQQNIESSQEIGSINSRLRSMESPITNGALPNVTTHAGYLIGPADLLEIRVFESEKLTCTVRVSSRGEITVPLLDNVYVEGLTARDAEIKVENLLREGDYIDNPHVGIFIIEHKSKVVSVMGYVNQPGSYELLGGRTLLDVLASAQGLSVNAGTIVYVTRSEEDGSKDTYLVDLDDLVSSDTPDSNLELQPGDLVYVPEAANVFVEGAVDKPGAYPINRGKTTLSEAIIMAGGVASIANSDVTLIRYLGNGRKEVLNLNLNSIQEGLETDPLLNEKDAIIVGASGIKSFLYGFRISIFGLGGIGFDPPR